MRCWIIIFEAVVSIIILTTAYLIFLSHFKGIENLNYKDSTINMNNFRNFFEYCQPNYVYIIYNISSKNYRVCINGEIKNLEDIQDYKIHKKYLFSGYKNYEPFILILYK